LENIWEDLFITPGGIAGVGCPSEIRRGNSGKSRKTNIQSTWDGKQGTG
jgi:hypothetical protein